MNDRDEKRSESAGAQIRLHSENSGRIPRTVTRNGLPKCIPKTLREQQKHCETCRPTLTLLSKIMNDPDEKRSESVKAQMWLHSENSRCIPRTVFSWRETACLNAFRKHSEISGRPWPYEAKNIEVSKIMTRTPAGRIPRTVTSNGLPKCEMGPVFIGTFNLLIANRKLATRFPTRYRSSPYVTPNSPNGWLKK